MTVELVWCDTHTKDAYRGARNCHEQTPECVAPHRAGVYMDENGTRFTLLADYPSMTGVETLDPREAVTTP